MPRYAADNSMREKQLNIRLSPEESARLEIVAEHYSLSAAAVLRMLVKREHDQISGLGAVLAGRAVGHKLAVALKKPKK